jgi:hypothetical protein
MLVLADISHKDHKVVKYIDSKHQIKCLKITILRKPANILQAIKEEI